MAVAYRADAGGLTVSGASTAQNLSFPGTQPVAGDLVVAGGGWYVGTLATRTITDNQGGGTYAIARVQDEESGSTTQPIAAGIAGVWYRENITNAGTFTLTFDTDQNPAGVYYACSAIAFSGVATSGALDVVASAFTADVDQASQGTGTTGSKANSDSVAITALCVGNDINVNTLTVTGYSTVVTVTDGTANQVGGLAYKVLSAGGTETATWTYGLSSGGAANDHAAVIAVFKGVGSTGWNTSGTGPRSVPLPGAGPTGAGTAGQFVTSTAGGAGNQTLTPSLFSNTNSFFAPTVTPGAVTLTPGLYSDGDSFFAPALRFILQPSLYSDADSFFAPTVTPGAVTLTPGLFSDGDTFFAPTVSPGAVTLSPSLVTDGDTFFAHDLFIGQTLAPSLYSNTNSFFSPVVSPGAVTLTPSLYSDGDSFFAAVITQAGGGQTLLPPLYSDTDAFFAPTVTPGAISLAPPLYSDGDAFFAATVTGGAGGAASSNILIRRRRRM